MADTRRTASQALRSGALRRYFSEKESGAKTDRKALQKALAALEPADVLLVNSPGPIV
jgi:DNA invertase Pin-like site-specific DNA recombinase